MTSQEPLDVNQNGGDFSANFHISVGHKKRIFTESKNIVF